MRNVIVHYHLFKNAGSSVDHILHSTFGEKWVNYDPGDPPHLVSGQMLADYLDDNPQLDALSSHMLVPPLPATNIGLHPIIFLREPITRVMSAYLFEWQKQKQLDKPSGSLTEYIESKFDKPRTNAIENFQCLRLCNDDPNRIKATLKTDEELLQTAMNFISSLPAFGLVHRFDDSMDLFQSVYGRYFSDLKFESVTKNSTQNIDLNFQERIDHIEAQIGKKLFDELVLRNQLDIKLFQYACGLFDAYAIPKAA